MRRRFFLFAAPAIVAAPSLMRVSTLLLPLRKETLTELLARKLKEAEEAIRADIMERVFDDLYTQPSGPPFGLATLIADDTPIGGINRTSFDWWDASVSIRIESA